MLKKLKNVRTAAAAFVAVGIVMLTFSGAAALINTIEVEDGAPSNGAKTVDIADASFGKAVEFGLNPAFVPNFGFTETARIRCNELAGWSDVANIEDIGCGALKITTSRPGVNATNVDPQASFNYRFNEPLTTETMVVELRESANPDVKAELTAPTLDLTQQSLSFVSTGTLKSSTKYTLYIKNIVALSGNKIPGLIASFTTGEIVANGSDKFERVKLDSTGIMFPTGNILGPDGHLYVSSYAGMLHRIKLDAKGDQLGAPELVYSENDAVIAGIAFEPGSADYIWATVWDLTADETKNANNASVKRINIKTGQSTVKVSNLPRHPTDWSDHAPIALKFNNGKLYMTVGSMTPGGDISADFLGEPRLRETKYTAALYEIDYQSLGDTPFVATSIEPSQTSAPIRYYSTGVRNAFGLLWHSNGNLYSNINQNSGSSYANSSAPTFGPCAGLPGQLNFAKLSDTIALLKKGKYYGHPNPSRNECIAMGGGMGMFKLEGYGSNVAPDPNFDENLIRFYGTERSSSFGVSVNGMDEYKGAGNLKGAILSADFAGSKSILVVKLGPDTTKMDIAGPMESLQTRSGEAIRFNGPLDVVSHPTNGRVYVVDFGLQNSTDPALGGIYVLVPAP